MTATIPSTANPTPSWNRDPDQFYGAVNAHRLSITHGWCPDGTASCLILTNPDHPDLDLVFCDDVPAFAAQLITRLSDEQLFEILSKRFGSGMLELPLLDPPAAG